MLLSESQNFRRADVVVDNGKVPSSHKLTVQNGQLRRNGKPIKEIYINAHDLFADQLTGSTRYQTQLPQIAGYGVKLIRVHAGPFVSETWATQVGTDGAAPVTGYLTALKLFLDHCAINGIGVELSLFWSYMIVPGALSRTVADYLTPGSITRSYMVAFATTIAKNFRDHPALAAYNIGNEWFDRCSIAGFASASTDTTKDHFGAMEGTCNDIVAAIRTVDPDRAVFAPTGSGGSFESGQPAFYIDKLVKASGNCDVVAFHLYPNVTRSGFAHGFVGRDVGSATRFLKMARAACMRVGKAFVVEELGAEDDNTTYSGLPVGTFSSQCYDAAFDAGCELVGDWSWYADTPSAPDLRTDRVAVMSIIQARNAALSASPSPALMAYPKIGDFPVPSGAARGTGASNSNFRIPNHPDLFADAVSTAKWAIMFWMRKQPGAVTPARVFASNDPSSFGYLLTPDANDGLTIQFGFSGTLTSFTPVAYQFPAWQPATPMRSFAGEWNHYAILWDGSQDAAPQGDGLQHMVFWMNGLEMARMAPGSPKTPGDASVRELYFMSSSDGLSNLAKIDICDVMIGKNFTLTSADVNAYLDAGTVPTGMQHRWKLDSVAGLEDSIGSLNAVAGANLAYVTDGPGKL